MRAVVQRVSRARVTVVATTAEAARASRPAAAENPPLPGDTVGRIGPGLLIYAAAAPDDADDDIRYIAEKIAGLRIFRDEADKMNLSVREIGGAASCAVAEGTAAGAIAGSAAGAVLLVSAFTVQADARKGRRPSFDASASGPVAEPLIDKLATALRALGLYVETGRFGAYMLVESVNDGPICILLDSRKQF